MNNVRNIFEKVRHRAGAALALVVVFFVSWWSPARGIDETLTSFSLSLTASRAPPANVFLIRLGPKDFSDGACAADLARAVRELNARSVVLWGAAGLLCDPGATGRPVVHLTRDHFGVSEDGTRLRGGAALGPLGAPLVTWIRPAEPRNLPSAFLADVLASPASWTMAKGRVVVVEVPEGDVSDGARAAAAISAVLGSAARGPLSSFGSGILGVVVFAAAITLYLRSGKVRSAALMVGLTIGVLFLLQLALLPLLAVQLLPLGSLACAVTLGLGALLVEDIFGTVRSLRTAVLALRRAEVVGPIGLGETSEVDFFSRLARFATEVYPSDFALIADVEEKGQFLRFWECEGATEAVLAERRRDIRRQPFSDEEGVLRVRVVRGLLLMRDKPVVVIPLLEEGEALGLLLLAGEEAEVTHRTEPQRTDRLARELAALLRQRRSNEKSDLEHKGSTFVRAMEALSRRNLRKLELLEATVRRAPAHTLLADSLGRIVHVGAQAAELLGKLPELGAIKNWARAESSPLRLHGVLLAALGSERSEVARTLAAAMDKKEGRSVVVSIEGKSYDLALLALHGDDGVILGYATTLTPAKILSAETRPSVIPLSRESQAPAVLRVLDVGVVVENAVEEASSRSTGASVLLGSPLGTTYAIVPGGMGSSLADFLTEAASLAKPDRPVIVSLREKTSRVELTILDLDLGVPPAVVQRVLDAPSAAPDELAVLGRLARRIEAGQGRLRLRSEGGWGLGLVISLIKAKPSEVVRIPPPSSVKGIEALRVVSNPRRKKGKSPN